MLGEVFREGTTRDDDGPPSVRTTTTGDADGMGTPEGPGTTGGNGAGAGPGLAGPRPATPGAWSRTSSHGNGNGSGAAGVPVQLLAASASGSTSGRSLVSTVGAGNSGVGLGGGSGARIGRSSARTGAFRARSTRVLTFDHKVKAPEEHQRILVRFVSRQLLRRFTSARNQTLLHDINPTSPRQKAGSAPIALHFLCRGAGSTPHSH